MLGGVELHEAEFIAGDAFESSLHYSKMRALGKGESEYLEEFIGGIESYYRKLPRSRFPYLVDNVDTLIADGNEARFEYGLDLFIAGLEAKAPRRN